MSPARATPILNYCFYWQCKIYTQRFAEDLVEVLSTMGKAPGPTVKRALKMELANSGIELRLSSMASFRPDGNRYDGAGIQPDVVVEPTLSDVLGATDSQLDAAVKLLQQR